MGKNPPLLLGQRTSQEGRTEVGRTVAYTLPRTCSTDDHTDDQDRHWGFNAPPLPDPCVSLTKKHAPKHSGERNLHSPGYRMPAGGLERHATHAHKPRTRTRLGSADTASVPCGLGPPCRASPLHLQTAHIAGLRVPLGEEKRAILAGSPTGPVDHVLCLVYPQGARVCLLCSEIALI